MKLGRLWRALVGMDEELNEMKAQYAQAQQELHESTQRLGTLTHEAVERTLRIEREDAETRREIERLGASDGD